MDNQVYDVIVVGGGAAGLTAGLFATRRSLKTLIVSQDIGGQAATTPEIENYPGIDFVDGFDLMKHFKSQAEKYGATFVLDSVTEVLPQEDTNFLVKTNTQSFVGQTVILAFGLSHRKLEIPGEAEFEGKGVLYCSVCNPLLYTNKDLIVVGGGSSAVQAALSLSKQAKTVTIVNLMPELRAETIVQERIKMQKNISVVNNAESQKVEGDERVTGLTVLHKDTGQKATIPASCIFVEIGYVAKAAWIKGLVDTDQRNQVIISANCETSRPGIFAAGDITTITFKQVVISAGEGAKAALEAEQYLLRKLGKRGARIDWGKKK